jgi:hypothetical protein
MPKQFTFTATLERETNRDGSSADFEFDVEVTYSYSPAIPGVMYLRNGDPGYPEEPAEVEILSCRPRDPHMGTDLVKEDALSDDELEYLTDRAFEDARDQACDPRD